MKRTIGVFLGAGPQVGTLYYDVRGKAILAEVERAVATWWETGLSIGLTEQELDQFADAFEHTERAAARRVVG